MIRWALLCALAFLVLFSGCRIGVSVGVEFRLGYVTFRSVDPLLFGPLLLDGREVGYLPPLGGLRCLVTLDFPHEVRVLASSCPEGVCVFFVSPPLCPSEVIPLSLPR